jgi:hypothetical protein
LWILRIKGNFFQNEPKTDWKSAKSHFLLNKLF